MRGPDPEYPFLWKGCLVQHTPEEEWSILLFFILMGAGVVILLFLLFQKWFGHDEEMGKSPIPSAGSGVLPELNRTSLLIETEQEKNRKTSTWPWFFPAVLALVITIFFWIGKDESLFPQKEISVKSYSEEEIGVELVQSYAEYYPWANREVETQVLYSSDYELEEEEYGTWHCMIFPSDSVYGWYPELTSVHSGLKINELLEGK